MNQSIGKAKKTEDPLCVQCLKPLTLCVCKDIKPVKLQTSLLILQHPQEPDKLLGTARLAHLSLENSRLKIGLSWANLEKAWGEKTERENWLVLYLGSLKLDRFSNISKPALILTRGKDTTFSREENLSFIEEFSRKKKRGIIVLDGTWSQAKTLWWRNAWLTRIQRGVLIPPLRSHYGSLRKEPRKESLSTIESAAYALQIIEKDPKVAEQLIEAFKLMLKKTKRNKGS